MRQRQLLLQLILGCLLLFNSNETPYTEYNHLDNLVRACVRFKRGVHGGGPPAVKNNWPGVLFDLRHSLEDMLYANAFVEYTKFKTAVVVHQGKKGASLLAVLDADVINNILSMVKQVPPAPSPSHMHRTALTLPRPPDAPRRTL